MALPSRQLKYANRTASNTAMARRCLHRLILPALLIGLACSSGCALIQPVAPWQKGMLARPEMSFEADRLDAAFNEHVYSSKEAAAGGSGVGGGGCGCN